jgi:hypothetical protein
MFTTETVISFSGSGLRERLKKAYGATIPQLLFVQKHLKDHSTAHGRLTLPQERPPLSTRSTEMAFRADTRLVSGVGFEDRPAPDVKRIRKIPECREALDGSSTTGS